MELRPQQYEDFSRFLLARVRFSSVAALINAGLNMVEGFRALHNRGIVTRILMMVTFLSIHKAVMF